MGQNQLGLGLCPGYKERTKKTNKIYSNYLQRDISFTTIADAAQHSFNPCLRWTSYSLTEDVDLTLGRPTHQIPVQCWASVTAHCWFNGGQLSTSLRKHVAFTQCCFNMLTHSLRRWPGIETVHG